MATLSGRGTNRISARAPPISPPVSRSLSHSLSLSLSGSVFLLFSPRARPSVRGLSFSHAVPSIGPLVGCNYDATRRRIRSASRPVALMVARCTHPSIPATIGDSRERHGHPRKNEGFRNAKTRRISNPQECVLCNRVWKANRHKP